MVEPNIIVLEGIGFYLAIAYFLLITLLALFITASGIRQDEKIETLNAEITQLKLSNNKLNGENWHYRLKYGELDLGKEVSSDVRNKM